MNIPVRRNIVFDNDLLIPRSALRVDLPGCLWLARSPGTRQRWEPLRHQIPNEDRCDGQIVIFFRSGGQAKIDARARIKLTSESTSLIPIALIWPVMSLVHDVSGTVVESSTGSLLRLSGQQEPPTSRWNEQFIAWSFQFRSLSLFRLPNANRL